MSRIEALKLPCSGLTETMRSLGTQGRSDSRPVPRLSGEFSPTSAAMDVLKGSKSEISSGLRQQWRNSSIYKSVPVPSSSGIGTEIQAILCGSGAATTSPIFGCSPPSRALNPLSQDSKFKSSRSVGSLVSGLAPAAAAYGGDSTA